jgi:hypothetical protein
MARGGFKEAATARGLLLVLAFVLLGLGGCTPRRNPLPEALVDEAAIPGLPGVRWLETTNRWAVRQDLEEALAHGQSQEPGTLPVADPPIRMLSISGGGANGAFGAGLLCGWTDAGTRPEFKIVSGISTGALIAPLAFLGRDGDPLLRRLYTSVGTRDLVGFWPRMITSGTVDSLADSYKVAALIRQYYDRDLVASIAREHRQGRRLYIGTASLDANRLVVWNMGAIALHETPAALALFHQVLLASVAIPVLFPPEKLAVEAQGTAYDELHADGGVVRQVFVFEALFGLGDLARRSGIPATAPPQLYVIQNLPVAPVYDPVQPVVTDIAGKAVMDLFANQGLGDLFRIYARARKHGWEFHLTAVPPDFKPRRRELFDTRDMQRLFAIGYDQGRSGVPWQSKPPGFP